MKKIIVAVAFLMGTFTISYGGEGDKVKVLSKDSSNTALVFNVKASSNETIQVDLYGITDELASISLINQRGSALFYEFVKPGASSVDINLDNVKPGTYYVKLNLNNEIRLKTIIVE
ncbi:MAG: T9SS type A sorting domain-containing protein [Brumimicrobium sp.]